MILDHLPLNREMTMNDIRNRVKDKTGQDISEAAVKIAIRKLWEDGYVDTDEINVGRGRVKTYRRVR